MQQRYLQQGYGPRLQSSFIFDSTILIYCLSAFNNTGFTPIEEKDVFRDRITPLVTDNYYGWSNDMEVNLKEIGLWRFVETPYGDRSLTKNVTTSTDEQTSERAAIEKQHAENLQRRDLAVAYILTSIEPICKEIVPKVRCPTTAWSILKVSFQAVSKAAIDEKPLKLQTIRLQKREEIVMCSNCILKLAGNLESAGHNISQIEVKRAL